MSDRHRLVPLAWALVLGIFWWCPSAGPSGCHGISEGLHSCGQQSMRNLLLGQRRREMRTCERLSLKPAGNLSRLHHSQLRRRRGHVNLWTPEPNPGFLECNVLKKTTSPKLGVPQNCATCNSPPATTLGPRLRRILTSPCGGLRLVLPWRQEFL